MFLFDAIFPVVALAGLGYFARAFGVFSEIETNAIERLAFWYLLPCLLFYGTATAEFPEQMNWRYLGGFYFVILCVYLFGMAMGRLLFGYGLRELCVLGMAGSYANVTVLGIPITLQLLGEAALVPMLLVIAVHNLILYTFGTMLVEFQESSGGTLQATLLRVGKEMLHNPISGSLIAGAVWNFTDIGFAAPLAATLELIRGAAIPGALFALGAGLSRYHIRGEIRTALFISFTKLLVQPLLMWWVLRHVLHVDLFWTKTAVMLAAMPVGISVYVFSRRYGSCETATATSIVMTSLGAIFSISFLVWLLEL
jgi:malonate transporter